MCRACTNFGFSTILVVADGKGSEFYDGIEIIDVGRSTGRIDRIVNTTRQIYKKALDLRADLYHLHDPELLPIGLRLKKAGYKVIFDSHEDVPLQLLAKSYLHPVLRSILSRLYRIYEASVCKKLDGIITATPFIRDKFACISERVQCVANYPILDELLTTDDWGVKKKQVCYVGSVGRVRGIEQMCEAMQLVSPDVSLNLAGQFDESTLHHEVAAFKGWMRVNELGLLDRSAVQAVLNRSMAGLVTLHPIVNYMDALPIKMFEYMSAGIPVIASDFPLWREIIEGNDCGLLVDPMKPAEIAQAIDKLVSNPELAQRLGANGRLAVQSRYNWSTEEYKLFQFYEQILSS